MVGTGLNGLTSRLHVSAWGSVIVASTGYGLRVWDAEIEAKVRMYGVCVWGMGPRDDVLLSTGAVQGERAG